MSKSETQYYINADIISDDDCVDIDTEFLTIQTDTPEEFGDAVRWLNENLKSSFWSESQMANDDAAYSQYMGVYLRKRQALGFKTETIVHIRLELIEPKGGFKHTMLEEATGREGFVVTNVLLKTGFTLDLEADKLRLEKSLERSSQRRSYKAAKAELDKRFEHHLSSDPESEDAEGRLADLKAVLTMREFNGILN